MGFQHGEDGKLRRRYAETGESPSLRQRRRGLGLPQEIGEVAFFAALAAAGRRRADAGESRIWDGFFSASGGFFCNGGFSAFWRFSSRSRFCRSPDLAHHISALIKYQNTYNMSGKDVTCPSEWKDFKALAVPAASS